MKPMPKELPVLKSSYELALYLIPAIEKMPRTHRFTLGDRILGHIYDILEMLTAARYSKDKLAILIRCNLHLERLRLLLRLCFDLKTLPLKTYGHATGLADEVGSMIGGWIRSEQEKKR
jgi:hypothetical protein